MQIMQAKIHVTLKNGVLDSQGKTILNAIHSLSSDCGLSFERIQNVRAGKLFILDIQASTEHDARQIAQQACEMLLANHVIEDYEIDI